MSYYTMHSCSSFLFVFSISLNNVRCSLKKGSSRYEWSAGSVHRRGIDKFLDIRDWLKRKCLGYQCKKFIFKPSETSQYHGLCHLLGGRPGFNRFIYDNFYPAFKSIDF